MLINENVEEELYETLAAVRDEKFDDSDYISSDGYDLVGSYVGSPYEVLCGLEDKLLRQQACVDSLKRSTGKRVPVYKKSTFSESEWRETSRKWSEIEKVKKRLRTYSFELLVELSNPSLQDEPADLSHKEIIEQMIVLLHRQQVEIDILEAKHYPHQVSHVAVLKYYRNE